MEKRAGWCINAYRAEKNVKMVALLPNWPRVHWIIALWFSTELRVLVIDLFFLNLNLLSNHAFASVTPSELLTQFSFQIAKFSSFYSDGHSSPFKSFSSISQFFYPRDYSLGASLDTSLVCLSLKCYVSKGSFLGSHFLVFQFSLKFAYKVLNNFHVHSMYYKYRL